MPKGVYERTEQTKQNIKLFHWSKNPERREKVVKKLREALEGKTYEEIYGERAEERREKNRRPSKFKGKTYEQIYGVGKAKEQRQKNCLGHIGKKIPLEYCQRRSESLIGKKRPPFSEEWKRHLSECKQGKTWEEMYGVDGAKKAKDKLRISRLKQTFPFKDTSIEVKLQEGLKRLDIPFEPHKPIFGQPDIFIEPNICIFADGCYWHGCEECFDINDMNGMQRARKVRDILVIQKLTNDGYVILRFWEHDINENAKECIEKIVSCLAVTPLVRTDGQG